MLSPVSPNLSAAFGLTDNSNPLFDLRRHKPSDNENPKLPSTASEKEKRLARRFQQIDGALLDVALADINDHTLESVTAVVDYLDDFVVAHAHAPLGTAVDGTSLACYVSRAGVGYVVDAGNIVYDVREPLVDSLLAARAKRRATAQPGANVPVPFASDRLDTHCTAVAWSRSLLIDGATAPLWLAVGMRSGRVALLRFVLNDQRFRLPTPVVVVDVMHPNNGDNSAVGSLLFTADSNHLLVGLANGAVVAFGVGVLSGRAGDAVKRIDVLKRSDAQNTAVTSLYEHPVSGALFAARAADVIALPALASCRSGAAPPSPVRWRAHDTALTGLSGGVAHGQQALLTSAFDGTVHFWFLAAPLKRAPTPIVLRRSGGGPVVGCTLADNTVVLYKMSGLNVRNSFAVMRETGQVESLLAPWSAERAAPPPARVDFASLPPRWGNVAPLFNEALYATALRDARAVDLADTDVRGALHAFVSAARFVRGADVVVLHGSVRAAAIRRHAREVLERCGAQLSEPTRALFEMAPTVDLRCPLCSARPLQRVPNTLDALVCANSHTWQLDVRTMALLGSVVNEQYGTCPACREPTITAPLTRDATVICTALLHMLVGVGGARVTPLCFGCRLPVLPQAPLALTTAAYSMLDVND